jgi:shikimate kinase
MRLTYEVWTHTSYEKWKKFAAKSWHYVYVKMIRETATCVKTHTLFIVSGISGSGKTTLGQRLALTLSWTFIDQDTFYLPNKPKVTLADQTKVSNWDCEEALDLKQCVEQLTEALKHNHVVFVGFAPRDAWLQLKTLPASKILHVHLSTGDDRETIISRCVQSRTRSKKMTPDRAALDAKVVRELVYPFYVDTLSKCTITHQVSVYDASGQRRSINELLHMLWTIK